MPRLPNSCHNRNGFLPVPPDGCYRFAKDLVASPTSLQGQHPWHAPNSMERHECQSPAQLFQLRRTLRPKTLREKVELVASAVSHSLRFLFPVTIAQTRQQRFANNKNAVNPCKSELISIPCS